jgi:hypothetical protein
MRVIVNAVIHVSQTQAVHTIARWLGGSMLQEVEVESVPTMTTSVCYRQLGVGPSPSRPVNSLPWQLVAEKGRPKSSA